VGGERLMPGRNDPRNVALGAAVLGARAGLRAGRVALVPVGLALRAPVAGPVLQRRIDELSAAGVAARTRARDAVMESDELEQLICTVIEHERTEVIVQRVMDSPGLERIVLRVLEGHLVDEIIDRVLHSPELDRIVEYVASSPQVLDAVSHQTRSLADEMAVNVRKRAESVDDAAERTVRGWLRRPRPHPA
jgi:hypothetical protein